ncbi:MAG: hypothetical protein WCK28_04975 [Burkholderiales bacterium]|jgi:hypothetical protein
MLNRILIALGIAWFAVGLWAGLEPLVALTTWPEHTVRVVDAELQPSHPGLGWRRNVLVEVPHHETQRARSINSAEARVGSRVAALTDPANPGPVYLPGETSFWLVPVGFLVGGVVCVLVGWTRHRNGGRAVHVSM